MKPNVIALAAAVALLAAASAQAESPAAGKPPAARSPIGFVKGYTWGWAGSRGSWSDDSAAESMRLRAAPPPTTRGVSRSRKSGHFNFAGKRTFLLCVDRSPLRKAAAPFV